MNPVIDSCRIGSSFLDLDGNDVVATKRQCASCFLARGCDKNPLIAVKNQWGFFIDANAAAEKIGVRIGKTSQQVHDKELAEKFIAMDELVFLTEETQEAFINFASSDNPYNVWHMVKSLAVINGNRVVVSIACDLTAAMRKEGIMGQILDMITGTTMHGMVNVFPVVMLILDYYNIVDLGIV